MLTHDTIWLAIDRLAQSNGYSTSGLAKKAGLDPTSFNRSKRIGADGKPRWPSTESISRILNATNATMSEFIGLIGGTESPSANILPSIPVIGFTQATRAEFFNNKGHPTGQGWDSIEFPHTPEHGSFVYALEISGDHFLPVFREGDRLIVAPNAPIRRGDRVVVKTASGDILVKELNRQTASKVELKSFHSNDADISFAARDILWVARIVWVSQ